MSANNISVVQVVGFGACLGLAVLGFSGVGIIEADFTPKSDRKVQAASDKAYLGTVGAVGLVGMLLIGYAFFKQ
jgi:hypothetical protein